MAVGKSRLLLLSLLNVFILSIGHAYNNQVLMYSAILVFLCSLILTYKNFFLPILLFYLPWATILKTKPNTFTFTSLVIPVILIMIFFAKDNKNLKVNFGFILLFTAYTLLVKLLNGLPLHTPYLLFIIKLFVISLYIRKYKENMTFETCTLFLTAGVLTACISAELLMKYPHMIDYIEVTDGEAIDIIRLSGFNGDPNYYSAQIIVAIAAIIIVLSKTVRKSLIGIQIFVIMILIYFGLKSISKMFIILLGCIILVWVFNLIIQNRNLTYKSTIVLFALTVIGFVILNNIFSEQINLYLMRLGYITDTASLTTGRSELWRVYLDYLMNHPDKIYFGIGLSPDQVQILYNSNNAHLTLIEIIYQVGFFGGLLLLLWWRSIWHEVDNKIKLNLSQNIFLLIMAAAIFLPWFVLDMIYSQEFFYFIILFFLAKNYLAEATFNSHIKLT